MKEEDLDKIDLDNTEEVKEEEQVTEEVGEIPHINSLEWTAFVLSKLAPDECYDGQPTANGLRRMAKEYLGTVVKSEALIQQSPNVSNGNHTCINYKVEIKHPDRFYWLGDLAGEMSLYSGVADVFSGNGTDNLFSWRYSAATCETRAKGRAYKEALNLRNVVTKEEISEVPADESGTDGYVGSQQFMAVNMMCARLNINAEDFLKHCWKHVNKDEKNYDDLNNMPFTTAIKALGKLSSFQQNMKDIPDSVKGYKAAWMGNYNK